MTWLALGDSITYINDHPEETHNRDKEGYMKKVVRRLPNIHYINQGHNGWTAGGIADSIDNLELVKADVYTVFLGTNDWEQSRPLGTWTDYQQNKGNATVYGSFRIIIDKLRELNPAAKIILMTPMERGDFVYIKDSSVQTPGSYQKNGGQALEQFAAAVRSIGENERFTVIDLYHEKAMSQEKLVKFKRIKVVATGKYKDYPYPDFVGLPYDARTDEYPYPPESIGMTYDGLHPSDAGNEVIEQRLIEEMKKY